MTTHSANEASDMRSLTAGNRPLPRPHLVSQNDMLHAPESAVASGTDPGSALNFSTATDPGWVEARIGARRLGALEDSRAEAVFKRAVDLLGVTVLAALFSPLILVILFVMWLEGGPILYKHTRVGRHGQPFGCLKFRTMVPDAEHALRDLLEEHPELKAEWLENHKLRLDPRVTRLGRFLRRTSLDELPQILNVFRGEMSLVGPRPVVREELMRYGRMSSIYLSTRPGITGLWQVTGRNDTDYRRRVALDVYYVRNRTVLLDLYILLKTSRVILGGRAY